MKTYSSSLLITLRESFYALFMPVLVIIVGGFFTDNYLLLGAVSAVLLVLYLAWVLIGSRLKFELDGSELRYYRRGKMLQVFDLKQSSLRYVVNTRGTDSTISFYITDHSKSEEEHYIDCSPLGANRFQKMYEDLRTLSQSAVAPEVLKG